MQLLEFGKSSIVVTKYRLRVASLLLNDQLVNDWHTKFFFDFLLKFAFVSGEIVFKDVVFSFPSRPNSPIINNMSLTIKPRTVTAVRSKIERTLEFVK